MGIYASAVALWFTAIALLLTGASIRAWFRSLPPVEVEGRRGDQRLIEIEVAAVQDAAYSNDAMTDLAALLKAADQMPYRAKRNPGRVTGRSVAATAH
jgi:hypothetical protein